MTEIDSHEPDGISPDGIARDQLAPGLLVAVPQLSDPNFERAVIFLLAHGDEGAFGLVLNRPSLLVLRDICGELGVESERDDVVLIGGPVEEQRGFLLHGDAAQPDSEAVADGVHLTGTPDVLAALCKSNAPMRLFVGYAGWGPGQLESELAAGAWLSLPMRAEYVYTPAIDGLWERVLRDAGIDPGMIAPGGGPAN